MTGGLALSRPVPADPASRTPSVGSARAGRGHARRVEAWFIALVDEAHRARQRGHRWTGLDHYEPGATTHDLSNQQGPSQG